MVRISGALVFGVALTALGCPGQPHTIHILGFFRCKP
jgi:hypothetical protein